MIRARKGETSFDVEGRLIRKQLTDWIRLEESGRADRDDVRGEIVRRALAEALVHWKRERSRRRSSPVREVTA